MDNIDQEYELLIGERHGYEVRIVKPDDIITVKLGDKCYRIDIIDYLNIKDLTDLSREYGIKSVNEKEIIRLLRLRIRGIREDRNDNCCEYLSAFTIITLVIIIGILLLTIIWGSRY